MYFKNWISQYKSFDSPMGDLAREILSAIDYPTEETKNSLKDYFIIKEQRHKNRRLVELFEIAWTFYTELYE